MEILTHLLNGFSVCLPPINLWYTFIGVLIGTIIGVLPGIGPSAGIALLIPVTYGMNPTSALIMMCGIYYGTKYGGSTTAILIKTPGEAASVMTTIDGYEMARKGRAGAALKTAFNFSASRSRSCTWLWALLLLCRLMIFWLASSA